MARSQSTRNTRGASALRCAALAAFGVAVARVGAPQRGGDGSDAFAVGPGQFSKAPARVALAATREEERQSVATSSDDQDLNAVLKSEEGGAKKAAPKKGASEVVKEPGPKAGSSQLVKEVQEAVTNEVSKILSGASGAAKEALQRTMDEVTGKAIAKVKAAPKEAGDSIAETLKNLPATIQKAAQEKVDATIREQKAAQQKAKMEQELRNNKAMEDFKMAPQRFVEKTLKDTQEAVANAPSAIATGVTGAAQSASASVVKGAQDAGANVVNTVGGAVTGRVNEIVDAIVSTPGNFAKGVTEELQRLPGRIAQAVEYAIQAALESLGAAPGRLAEATQKAAIEAVDGARTAAVETVERTQRNVVDSIQKAPSRFADGISSAATSTADRTKAGLYARVQSAGKDTQRLVDEIVSTPVVLGQGAGKVAARVGQAGVDSVNGAKEAVQAKVQEKVDEVTSIPTKTQEEAQRIFKDVMSAF